MKLSSILAVTSILVVCNGCETSDPFPPENILISRTAASKALGSGAIYTNLVPGKTFTPGRIFHVKPNGEVFGICEDDFKKQTSLQTLKPETTNFSNKIVEDNIRGSIHADVIGLRAGFPYKKIKVTGYKIDEVKAATGDGDTAAYILANLARKCRSEVLPRNRPYYVVTAVATADKVDVTEQSLLSIDKSASIFSFELGKEVSTYGESDVIFGIKGRKVSKPN
ncbi:hypothetical protein KX729_02025 [Rhizobium sp. XQZ8]|uniref:hypothetical protein n=1 Tax=Rhizobium populisoli TaxID=2859785 RepID=UPI001CA59CDC|nr:hypothetical protein [Rhizobium populisoli]MBW6420208.1 hypothetical protein [Rhizobium populisoli]